MHAVLLRQQRHAHTSLLTRNKNTGFCSVPQHPSNRLSCHGDLRMLLGSWLLMARVLSRAPAGAARTCCETSRPCRPPWTQQWPAAAWGLPQGPPCRQASASAAGSAQPAPPLVQPAAAPTMLKHVDKSAQEVLTSVECCLKTGSGGSTQRRVLASSMMTASKNCKPVARIVSSSPPAEDRVHTTVSASLITDARTARLACCTCWPPACTCNHQIHLVTSHDPPWQIELK